MVQEEIFRFEVPMDYTVLVNVLYSGYDLLHEPDCFCFIETFSLDDVVEKLAPLCIFHDQMDVSFGLNDFVKLDDVWMTQDFEYAYFSGDSLDVRLFYNFLFLQGLYGDFLLCQDMGAEFDFSKGSFAYWGTDSIVSEDYLGLSVGGHYEGGFEFLFY